MLQTTKYCSRIQVKTHSTMLAINFLVDNRLPHPPPIPIEAVFFTAVKLLLLHIITSLTRRTINSHDLRKTNHLGGSLLSTKKLIAIMVECVLTWIREQYLVVCNIAKWTILCIVRFQPVIKLLQKGVRVHHRRVILMQKMQKFSGKGHSPSPIHSFKSSKIVIIYLFVNVNHINTMRTVLSYYSNYVSY